MKNNIESVTVFELNKMFSTTRRVIRSDMFHARRPGEFEEGGLRTRGFYKHSDPGKPLISVITVVRDGGVCIEQAILSVIKQTYDNVEYIIVDGGSTDKTLEIIKKYDDAVDYWISEPDEGVYDAMNKGLKLFHGDYVLFLGCDDCLHDVFHEVVGFFNDSLASYYGNVVLSNSRKVYGGKFFSLKLFIQNIPHQAIFYSKHVFDEYRYSRKYITVADYDLNLKIFANNKYGLKYIPKIIANYNNEHGISSTLVDHNFSKNKPEIIHNHYSAFYYWIYMMLRFVFKKKK